MSDQAEIRDTQIERSATAADPAWRAAVDATIIRVADLLHRFTSDDVWDALPDNVSTHEPRALGAALIAAERAGLIVRCGHTNSRNRQKGLTTVWRRADRPLEVDPEVRAAFAALVPLVPVEHHDTLRNLSLTILRKYGT